MLQLRLCKSHIVIELSCLMRWVWSRNSVATKLLTLLTVLFSCWTENLKCVIRLWYFWSQASLPTGSSQLQTQLLNWRERDALVSGDVAANRVWSSLVARCTGKTRTMFSIRQCQMPCHRIGLKKFCQFFTCATTKTMSHLIGWLKWDHCLCRWMRNACSTFWMRSTSALMSQRFHIMEDTAASNA